ncbi:nuclear transport factor 2 family protein [uncultured Microbulbifer sp.]|uniref:nuclear transport factor 2 family protein n=1 Tax=uncultured Microbulbifer sp. TaxID=348147 RepID=UPI002619A158|nr:nuclear transport factor 2 family protein [uncultured Microbulbifer sp.]
MYRIALYIFSTLLACAVNAHSPDDKKSIERAMLDYIESQHQVKPNLMRRGLDKKLAKRTFWKAKDGSEFIMETDYETMIWIAENYNKDDDKFPPSPKIDIDILDIDNRAASVKLSVDEWIDYAHLYKNDKNEWKIINVLWQYHDTKRHVSKK